MEDPPYIFHGADIYAKEVDVDKKIFNAVRELVQKEAKDHKLVMKYKKLQRIGENQYTCPVCKEVVKNLECAHVGERHCDIIRDLMKDNPGADTMEIYRLDREHHRVHAKFAIVCKKCNADFEN